LSYKLPRGSKVRKIIEGLLRLIIMKQIKDRNSKIFDEILGAIKEIKYGEVVIVINDYKIVRIEKKEKKRF
jgi:hypothetical protein